jgi:hypothetical protein
VSFDAEKCAHDQNAEQALLERAQSPAANFSSAKEADAQRAGTTDDAAHERAPGSRGQPCGEQSVAAMRMLSITATISSLPHRLRWSR